MNLWRREDWIISINNVFIVFIIIFLFSWNVIILLFFLISILGAISPCLLAWLLAFIIRSIIIWVIMIFLTIKLLLITILILIVPITIIVIWIIRDIMIFFTNILFILSLVFACWRLQLVWVLWWIAGIYSSLTISTFIKYRILIHHWRTFFILIRVCCCVYWRGRRRFITTANISHLSSQFLYNQYYDKEN